MTSKHNLERLSGALEHAWSHFYHDAETPQAQTPPAFTIALSREAGVPDSEVAHEVGQRLGWPVYDHELLERIAEEMHLRPSLLQKVDERPVHWIVERLQTFMTQPDVTEPAYVEHLISTLLALAAHGQCVVVGRGAAHLLRPETTLRVRLVAPVADRIGRLARERGLANSEAARRVEMIDRERAEFVRQYFHRDATDPGEYDLILNAARLSVEQSAEMVIEALHRMEAKVGAATV